MRRHPANNYLLVLTNHVLLRMSITSYGQLLPIDVLGLIAPYVLYDSAHQHEDYVALFAAPIFGHFAETSTWATIIKQRAHILYRRELSSNDYTAGLFLCADGTVDYPVLWNSVNAGNDRRIEFSDKAPTELETAWRSAHEKHYDVRLATLRGVIAGQAQVFRRSILATSDHFVHDRLKYYLRLPGLLAVPHPALEGEIIALCALFPKNVYSILLFAKLPVIHYSLWRALCAAHVEPLLGARLSYTGQPNVAVPHDITAWRGLWLQAALQADDVDLFAQICTNLRYSRADIVGVLQWQVNNPLQLSMTDLCRYDGLTLLTALDLWDSITPRHVAEIIIPAAPRLRAALGARGYVLPHEELAELNLQGLPAHICPFLPPTVTPLFITQATVPTPALFHALVRRCQRELTRPELCRLLTNSGVKRANLAGHVFPAERLDEPAQRASFIYLDQLWQCNPANEWGAVAAPAPRIVPPGTYVRLYCLLLAYVVEWGAQLRTPFRRYPASEVVHDERIIKYDQTRSKDGKDGKGSKGTSRAHDVTSVTLLARPHPRLLILKRARSAVFDPDIQRLDSNELTFVYLPAHDSVRITNLPDGAIRALYDYAVANWAWWCAAYRARYDPEAHAGGTIGDGEGTKEAPVRLNNG